MINIPNILKELQEITKSLDAADQNINDARHMVREIQLDMALLTLRVEEVESQGSLN